MCRWRIDFLFYLVILIGAAIISRLFYLQVINHKFYQAQALGQQTIYQETVGARGGIFLQDKKQSVAVNNDNWLVYVLPQEIEDKKEAAGKLSKIIGLSSLQITAKIENQNSYTVIKNKLTDQEVSQVKDAKIKGAYLDKTPGRLYSQNNFASQVVGFLGGDGTGQYGLEGYYNGILSGKKNVGNQADAAFLFDESNLGLSSLDGSDIFLTLDYNIQFEAESLLKKAKNKFDIDSGQIIVMEPSTGKIFAMVNFPSFNPNEYSKEKDISVFQNSAIQKVFELGSILKPITMSIAINEGKVTPETTYLDEGCVKVGIANLCNFGDKKYGVQTMTQVLEKSLNTGGIFLSKLIPHTIYLDYFNRFGFSEKTGIDLQGEIVSQNSNLRNGSDVNFATASYGQGIDLTPLQLIRAFSAIVNDGKLVKPYIVDKVVDNQGKESSVNSKTVRQVIMPETSSKVKTMLVSVIENGLAVKAKVPGYYLGGKTGTAQIPRENERGYYDDKTIQSFIGFGPALNPRFVAMVKLDNPKGNPSSGMSAAPIFSELAQYILNYWQIPPDYSSDNTQ